MVNVTEAAPCDEGEAEVLLTAGDVIFEGGVYSLVIKIDVNLEIKSICL